MSDAEGSPEQDALRGEPGVELGAQPGNRPQGWKPRADPASEPPRADGKPVNPPLVVRRPSAQTESLRATLAGTEAEARALREQLDELRRSLADEAVVGTVTGPNRGTAGTAGTDRGPAAANPGRAARTEPDTEAEDRHRRLPPARLWLGLLAVLVGVLVVAAAARGMTGAGSRPAADPGTTTAPPAATGTGTATGTRTAGSPSGSSPSGSSPSGSSPSGSSPSASGTASREELRPLPWPGGAVLVPPGLATSGPGVDAPGSDVAVAVDPDGRHLDVFERIAFPEPGVRRLDLALAEVGDLTRSLGRRTTPVVQDLQVQLGSDAVPAVSTGAGRFRADVLQGRPVTTAVLRYRLDRALFRAPNSPARRYYGIAPALAAGTSAAAGRPIRARVVGEEILNVTCPLASASLCGAPSGSAWTATLPAGGPAVLLLQVTLPER